MSRHRLLARTSASKEGRRSASPPRWGVISGVLCNSMAAGEEILASPTSHASRTLCSSTASTIPHMPSRVFLAAGFGIGAEAETEITTAIGPEMILQEISR